MFEIKLTAYVLILTCSIQLSHTKTTPEQKKKFLDMHNELREKIRNCTLPGQPPVRGTYELMTWDEAVEAQAQRWSDNCKFGHGELAGVGQNAAIAGSLEQGVKLWIDENVNYNLEANTCTPGRTCLHYTQMVWATSTLLGCGVTECPENGTTLFICDYKPPGNYRGAKPYEAGTQADCVTSSSSPPTTTSTTTGQSGKGSTPEGPTSEIPTTEMTSDCGNLRQKKTTVVIKYILFTLIPVSSQKLLYSQQ
ncbi:pathogenesis-related protein PR-1 type [Clonorchis sinensis]|uniref:Pathogenesis-related protein PR-1 type n=1 Tax=Clonorchis sinensis TaxID=79923 RepID=G7Y4P9_CLOSI|nr:pathogenesis-related protein PR-1 type [Clonorchis sinensis]